MQPDDRGIRLRRRFDFDGFQHRLNVPENLRPTSLRSKTRAVDSVYSPHAHYLKPPAALCDCALAVQAHHAERAIEKLGFVQADPIRAPARAQDLTLRHRVKGYCAGDLERLYPELAIEEDFFVNYGFLPRSHHALMHPRKAKSRSSPKRIRQTQEILAFVRERGVVHPREVDAHFEHGRVTNWFGGSSNASTKLLDHMHYRGLLRVARRDGGTRVYIAREARWRNYPWRRPRPRRWLHPEWTRWWM